MCSRSLLRPCTQINTNTSLRKMARVQYMASLRLTTARERTMRVCIHSSFATAGHPYGALLDSTSPATFVNSNALGTMMYSGAANESCVAQPRAASGEDSGKRKRSTFRKLSADVCSYPDTVPTAPLTVCDQVIPANTTRHQLLLGRDSFMVYHTRDCVTAPPSRRPLFRRTVAYAPRY